MRMKMAKITRATSQFENVPMQNDLANKLIHWDQTYHGNTATLVGSQIYFLGAARRESAVDTVREEDVLCLEWSTGISQWKGVGTPQLSTHRSFLVNDCIFVVQEDGDSLWKFDLVKSTWCSLQPQSSSFFPPSEAVCEFVEASRELVFVGSYSRDSPSVSLNVDSLAWSVLQTTGAPPVRRVRHSSCVLPRRRETIIFVFGGDGHTIYSGLYALHCAGHQNCWSHVPLSSNVLPVSHASLTNIAGMVFLYGGFDNNLDDTSQLFRYDTSDGTCTDFSQNHSPKISESCHDTLVVQDTIVIFGGDTFAQIRVLRAATSDSK